MVKGLTLPVNSVAWGKGYQLASASDHRTVVVWNATSCEQVSTVQGRTQLVKAVLLGARATNFSLR